MTKLLQQQNPDELVASPALCRSSSDDSSYSTESQSYYSFPDGYCYLFAAAYRLGILRKEEIIADCFPAREQLIYRLIDSLRKGSFGSMDARVLAVYIDLALCNLEIADIYDLGFYFSPVDEDFLDNGDLRKVSDLVLVQHTPLGGRSTWHVYFNPSGDVAFASEPRMYYNVGIKRSKGNTRKAGTKKVTITKKPNGSEVVKIQPSNNKGRPMKRAKARMTPAGKWLRTAGSIAGTFLGNAKLGRDLGAGISRIFGQGDYSVRSNSLLSGGPPAFSPLNSGIRISHREYLGDILSSIGFTNYVYRIQPNNSTTFPWLSQLASSFEQYKFNGLCFFLNSTSGNAVSSTNNALGTWGATTVYDPSKAPLPDKKSCEDYNGCTAGIPSQSILHPVECAPKSDVLERYFIDYQNTQGEDKKFYDVGSLNLFVQGQQAQGVTLGELWVTYDISFFNPRLKPPGEDNNADHYSVAGASIVPITPMGTAANIIYPNAGSALGSYITTAYDANSAALTMPFGSASGRYLICYAYSGGAAMTTGRMDFTFVSNNCSFISILRNGTSNFYNSPTTSANQYCTMVTFSKNDTNPATIRLGNANTTLPTSGTGSTVDLWLIPLGPFMTKLDKEEERRFNEFEMMFSKVSMDKKFLHNFMLNLKSLESEDSKEEKRRYFRFIQGEEGLLSSCRHSRKGSRVIVNCLCSTLNVSGILISRVLVEAFAR